MLLEQYLLFDQIVDLTLHQRVLLPRPVGRLAVLDRAELRSVGLLLWLGGWLGHGEEFSTARERSVIRVIGLLLLAAQFSHVSDDLGVVDHLGILLAASLPLATAWPRVTVLTYRTFVQLSV